MEVHELKKSNHEIGNENFKIRSRLHSLQRSFKKLNSKSNKMQENKHKPLLDTESINSHLPLNRSISMSNNLESTEEFLSKYGLYKADYTTHFPVDENAEPRTVIRKQSNPVSPTRKEAFFIRDFNFNAFEKIKNNFHIPESEETINIIKNLKALTIEEPKIFYPNNNTKIETQTQEIANSELLSSPGFEHTMESGYQSASPTKNEAINPLNLKENESTFSEEMPSTTSRFKAFKMSRLFKKKDKNNNSPTVQTYYGENSVLPSPKSLQTLYTSDSQLNDAENKEIFEQKHKQKFGWWNDDKNSQYSTKKPLKLQAKSEQNILDLYRRKSNFNHLLPVSLGFLRVRVHETKYVTAVFESANNGLGPILADIEKEFSHWLGVKSRLLVVACEVHWSVPERYRSRAMEIE